MYQQGAEKKEPIAVTRHGKPYALIEPISEQDLETWSGRASPRGRPAKAWEGEDDSL